jgi:hypothetical protein
MGKAEARKSTPMSDRDASGERIAENIRFLTRELAAPGEKRVFPFARACSDSNG